MIVCNVFGKRVVDVYNQKDIR